MKTIKKRKLPPIDTEILVRRLAGVNRLLGEHMKGSQLNSANLGRVCGMIEGYLAAFEAFPPNATIQNIRIEVNRKIFGFVYQKYESYQAALYRISSEFLVKYPPIYPDDDNE